MPEIHGNSGQLSSSRCRRAAINYSHIIVLRRGAEMAVSQPKTDTSVSLSERAELLSVEGDSVAARADSTRTEAGVSINGGLHRVRAKCPSAGHRMDQ